MWKVTGTWRAVVGTQSTWWRLLRPTTKLRPPISWPPPSCSAWASRGKRWEKPSCRDRWQDRCDCFTFFSVRFSSQFVVTSDWVKHKSVWDEDTHIQYWSHDWGHGDGHAQQHERVVHIEDQRDCELFAHFRLGTQPRRGTRRQSERGSHGPRKEQINWFRVQLDFSCVRSYCI